MSKQTYYKKEDVGEITNKEIGIIEIQTLRILHFDNDINNIINIILFLAFAYHLLFSKQHSASLLKAFCRTARGYIKWFQLDSKVKTRGTRVNSL